MPAPRHARHGPPLAGGALAVLLLAACGGSDPAPPAVCVAPADVTVDAATSWKLFGPDDWNPACATLTVHAPALAADERLALVLVNAGGLDTATPSITLAGTLAFSAADGAPVASLAPPPLDAPSALASLAPAEAPYDRSAIEAGHALVVARRQASSRAMLAVEASLPGRAQSRILAVGANCPVTDPEVGTKRNFCVDKLTGSQRSSEARTATLQHVTPNALFYVTDDVWPAVRSVLLGRVTNPADLWLDFEDYFEGTSKGTRNLAGLKRIRDALHQSFGQESDYDANCRVTFLFANLTKDFPAGSSSIVVGFFDPWDLQAPDPGLQDTVPTCTGSSTTGAVGPPGSNGADMLYLLDPATFIGKTGRSASDVLDGELPGTMAHELQHNVIENTRCRPSRTSACQGLDDPAGDLWLNEGLSMVSEDFAGFGLNTTAGRARVGVYLSCRKPSPDYLCHRDASLTTWPTDAAGNSTGGDPYGNYGGSHAFLRWHLDQAADPSAFSRAMVASTQPSRAAFSSASGLSFEEGYARFGTAALFSGEDAMFTGYPLKPSPDWSFAAAPALWSPLHAAVGRVGYTSLPRPGTAAGAPFPTSLKKDGWGSFVTGKGRGTEATLTITSTAAVKPRVAVVRFKGNLIQP